MSSQSRDITSFFKPVSSQSNSKSRSPERTQGEGIRKSGSSRRVAAPKSPESRCQSSSAPSKTDVLGSPQRANYSQPLSIRTPTKPRQPQFTLSPPPSSACRESTNETHSSQDAASFHTAVSSFEFPATVIPKSHRTVKKGEVIIRGSDDDGSDSLDDSLADPDELFGVREPATSCTPPDILAEEEKPTSSTRDMGAVTRAGTKRAREEVSPIKKTKPSKPFTLKSEPPKYKFSLQRLVQNHWDDHDTEAAVTKLRSSYDEENTKRRKHDLDKKVLASVVDGSEEIGDFQKLVNAVRRTEALDQEKSWSFFGAMPTKTDRSAFPPGDGKPGSWPASLKDRSIRERAFLSGYIGEISSHLSDEMMFWLLDEVVLEPRDDVRYAYGAVLKLSKPETVSRVQRSNIERMLTLLGARPEALDPDSDIELTTSNAGLSDGSDWKFLLSFLDVLQNTAQRLSGECLEYVTSMLLRLTMDIKLMNHGKVSIATENALAVAIDSFPEASSDEVLARISGKLFDSVVDSALEAECLKHILPLSPRTSLFRDRLSIAFFLNKRRPLTEPLANYSTISKLEARLHSKRFDTGRHGSSKSTDYDYSRLTAQSAILNIAIDAICIPTGCFETSAAETTYNESIDSLASRVKAIVASITDGGATHMKRNEAKEALEVLYYRLLYGVRSKPPQKKSVFGSTGGGEGWDDKADRERSSALMQNFLKGQKGIDSVGLKIDV